MAYGTKRSKTGTGGSGSKRKKGYAMPRNKVGTGGASSRRKKGSSSRR